MTTAAADGATPQWDPINKVWLGDKAAASITHVPDPLWIFGYGSLCWSPAFKSVDQFNGVLRGWSRVWTQLSADHRGTPQCPGVVVTLLPHDQAAHIQPNPGPLTQGVCYKVHSDNAAEVLAALDFREKGGYSRDAVQVEDPATGSIVDALLYVATPDNPNFDSSLNLEETAKRIATAHGPSGPNSEYLLKMVLYLKSVVSEEIPPDAYTLKLGQVVEEILDAETPQQGT